MRIPESILITGAAGDIGSSLAYAYAKPGVKLHLIDIKEEKLGLAAEACRARGAEVNQGIVDITRAEDMRRWIEEADRKKPLDLVIAIAGVCHGSAAKEETEEEIRSVFDVNLDGMLNTILPALPMMRRRGRGQIALMSSQAGARGFPIAPSYSATKAAIRVYGEALRGRLARENIGVSVINPGFIESAMTDDNPYYMPFLVPREKAVRIIKDQLSKNRAHIVFPWLFKLGAALVSLCPMSLFTRVVSLKKRR